MNWAEVTSRATLGLDSKVCGSVPGLFRIEDTCTYRPPIWASTSAYSFSAPMTLITVALGEDADVAVLLQPAAATASAATAPASAIRVPLGEDLRAAGRPVMLTIRGNIV